MSLEIIIAIISGVIAAASFLRAWLADKKSQNAQELQQISSRVDEKLTEIKTDIDEIKSDVKHNTQEIVNLKIEVGKHDVLIDRDPPRPLRAVNE